MKFSRPLSHRKLTKPLKGHVSAIGGKPIAGIVLSNSSFVAGSAQGTVIGNLSVVHGIGIYTFTLIDSASSKVQVAGTNGVNLQVGSASSSAGSFSITVQANNGAGSIFTKVFLITVTPVFSYVPTFELLGF